MASVKGAIRFWFVVIQEPKLVRAVMFVYYLSVIGSAFETLRDSVHLNVANPGFFTGLDFVLLALGACVGIVAIFPGQWGLERCGLFSIAMGLGLRATVLGLFDGFEAAPWILVGELALLVYRYVSIRKADLAPIAG